MDRKAKKRVLLIIVFINILAVISIYTDFYGMGSRNVITVGAFTGSYWDVQNGNSYKILDRAIEKFNEKYPNVRVEYTSGITKGNYSSWLYERLLEGNAPDVFFVFDKDFNSLSELGAMKDLSHIMEKDNDFDTDKFYSSAFSCGSYKDTQYALPYESAVNLMFVNKSILSKAGISMPSSDWTWEDFYNICRSITQDSNNDGINDTFGVCNYTWEDAMVSNGVELFGSDGTIVNLSSEGSAEALAFIERLNKLNDGYTVTSNDFDLGNAAFQPLMFSQYRAYKPYPLRVKKFSSFEWDCITMPKGQRGENTSYMDTLLIAMNNDTHNEKYAWELMKILTYDEEIQSLIFEYSEGASPLRNVTNSPDIINMLEKEENIRSSLLDYAMENATVTPSFGNYDSAVRMIDSAVNEILSGDSNISMSLIKKQRDINNYIHNGA